MFDVRERSPQEIGVAGELRIMSELVLRGFNPAKSYLDNGIDFILENGETIQAKTARVHFHRSDKESTKCRYQFTFQDWKGKKYIPKVDFLICWAINDNIFLIIPRSVIKASSVTFEPTRQKSKLLKYKNNWEILNCKERE